MLFKIWRIVLFIIAASTVPQMDDTQSIIILEALLFMQTCPRTLDFFFYYYSSFFHIPFTFRLQIPYLADEISSSSPTQNKLENKLLSLKAL